MPVSNPTHPHFPSPCVASRRFRSPAALAALALWFLALAAGAGEPDDPNAVAARVGEREITVTEVDAAAALPLHDLAMEAYRVRLETLEGLVAGEGAGESGAEILLAPPMPPRVALTPAAGSIRGGGADAPVTLAVYCNFQSRHCADLQPVLHALRERYGILLRQEHRDLPLPYHRHARMAAEAARCAGEQGRYWPYHDALYLRGGDFDAAALRAVARLAEVDADAIGACLAAGRQRTAVERDAASGRRIGLGSVPVSFVNGLYLRGPAGEARFRRLIDAELERLGYGIPPRLDAGILRAAPRSGLAWSVSGVAGRGAGRLALIAPEGSTGPGRAFRPGQRLEAGVMVARIEPERVYLDHDGRIEYLPVSGHAAEPVLLADGAPGDAEKGAVPPDPGMAEAGYRLPEPAAEITLPATLVTEALAEREALERQLEAAEHVVEGHALLRLGEIEPGGFYASLGLRAGDVLMRVNGEWIHADHNPLWRLLAEGVDIDLTVIRRGGLPRRFIYRAE